MQCQGRYERKWSLCFVLHGELKIEGRSLYEQMYIFDTELDNFTQKELCGEGWRIST